MKGPVTIPAPDHQSVLVARGTGNEDSEGVEVRLLFDGREKWKTVVMPGVGIEIVWSPDSKAFAITSSPGGRNGIYEAKVYLLQRESVLEVNVTPVVVTAFGHPVRCGWPEPPNVGVITWIVPSKIVLVAAEVVHHSNCDSFGTFETFEVDLTQSKVVGNLNQLEAKHKYRQQLGWEIKDAPDRCIRNPKSCWLDSNHQELTNLNQNLAK